MKVDKVEVLKERIASLNKEIEGQKALNSTLKDQIRELKNADKGDRVKELVKDLEAKRKQYEEAYRDAVDAKVKYDALFKETVATREKYEKMMKDRIGAIRSGKN